MDFRTSLANQAKRFLDEDSQSSANSSIEYERSVSPLKRSLHSHKTPSRRPQTSPHHSHHHHHLQHSQSKEPIARTNRSQRTSRMHLQSPNETRMNGSRSKSFGRRTEVKASQAQINERLAKPVSCQQEKYLLRSKIEELEQIINRQGAKVEGLQEKVLGKRDEVRDLTEQLVESRKDTLVIRELKEKVKELERNEFELVQELKENQKATQTAREKLHEIQESWDIEARRNQEYYEDYCQKRLEEQEIVYEGRLKKLEEENWSLSTKIREIEIVARRSVGQDVLKEKEIENERLRKEIQELRQNFAELERTSKYETRSLKRDLETLEQKNKNLMLNEEDLVLKESREKLKMKKKLKQLQDELQQKENALRERDTEDREHLEKMNKKVGGLQTELRKLKDCEEKIEKLEKTLAIKEDEVEMTKKRCERELEEARISQEKDKQEWMKLYNELVQEIKSLKGEIDNLDGNNQLLMSSLGLRSKRVY